MLIEKVDTGIYGALYRFVEQVLNHLNGARIILKKMHRDGELDYWSYYLDDTMYPFSKIVEHTIVLSGYASGVEESIAKLTAQYSLDNEEVAHKVLDIIINEETKIK